MKKHFTKSHFKLALDCPTKLYYYGKSEYADQMLEDPFLEALAHGGYQVGALAKCYFPGGIEVVEKGYDIPVKKTKEIFKKDTVTIYEAAFRFGNHFTRTDILIKESNVVNLIEVKAKSYSGDDYSDMLDSKGNIHRDWKEYVYDVAYQKYILQKDLPEYNIKSWLMFADKNAKASVNGLNQKFQLQRDIHGNLIIETTGNVSQEALGDKVLIQINTDPLTEIIYNQDNWEETGMTFSEYLDYISDHYVNDKKIITQFNKNCFKCQFKSEDENLKSGYKECTKHTLYWTDKDFKKPTIDEIWDYRRKSELIENGIYFLEDVKEEDIGDTSVNDDGTLSIKGRQWLQIERALNNDQSEYFDAQGMKDYMKSFKYPLHFIDFETSMVAIPFYKGRKPYEQTAFQFSHHIMYEGGEIEHAGQFLCTERGRFPNYDFLRELKRQLEQDKGTIFRYAAHENTVLNQICDQLNDEKEEKINDKNELINFIQSITYYKKEREGPRNMVDMLEMVKKFYYNPLMGKSNSIKYVLPAILNSSDFIKDKYSKPIYGKACEIRSLNFEEPWIWIQYDNDGNIISPYKLLPELFEDVSFEQLENYISDPTLMNGGAAMTAFAKMQFSSMSDTEKDHVVKGLLRYCELDTFAMVLIYEGWMKKLLEL